MDKQNELDMLRYFWTEKGDVTRYVNYESCIKEFPVLIRALESLRLAEITVTAAFDEEERRIDRGDDKTQDMVFGQ